MSDTSQGGMSDDSTNQPGRADDKNQTQSLDGEQKDYKALFEAEVADKRNIIRQRDDFKSKLRTLEGKLGEKDTEDMSKKGDVEGLRAKFQKDLDDVRAELQKKEERIKDLALRSVRATLAEITTDSEVSFLLLKDHFEVVESDNGDLDVRVKDSALAVKDWVEKTLEERGKTYLLKSDRKKGTDTKSTSAKADAAGMSLDQFNKMSRAEQQQWAVKNPEAMKVLLRQVRI